MNGKFSKKAKRHAAMSRKRTKKMLKGAGHRSGPVKVYYLPGFEPKEPVDIRSCAKFPFRATINGRGVWVSRNAYGVQFDYDVVI